MKGLALEKKGKHEDAINTKILPRLVRVEFNQKNHEEKMAPMRKAS
ncbi:hypothetical protein N0U24_07880 [Peribacillus frigoritolerans]|nr:hypothetical protein [Peribacillus frigoritolerans]MCT4477079.1 hypothetical protein [Peribacillus frigoritolerans]